MAKLIIDTSSWLEISKPKFNEVLIELENQIKFGQTVLLTSNIIIEEWERNKEKIQKEILDSIKSHAKSALKLTEFLDKEDSDILINLIGSAQNKEKKQEELSKKHFERAEKLLKESEVYTITDELKLLMADRAITKKAPFHNSKNNMADALIYFGAVEYVKKEAQIATDLFFVSANHKEFANPKDYTKIHPDLEKPNVHFYNNVAQALKMRSELVDEMDEYNESKLWEWIEWQAEIARGK